ncbi:glycosyltransferase family 4 protein [candidate division KSB1 bacterium]|nr:glycosyltransferase family 4 protein [candidate division KSB1 bacterium]
MNQKKGVLDLVAISAEIQKEFNQFVLYIAGSEKEAGVIAKIYQATHAHNLADKIHLLGEISGMQKLNYFLECHIFILPSYVENFPVSILEAMRAGMPVVTTPVGAIPEIINDQENGFIVPAGDIKQFASKIIKLCQDGSLRESISKTNLDKALKNYSPEQYKTQLCEIYQQLINSSI